MNKVIVDISMSLDGFVAGPNDGPANGLGDGGEVLHRWALDDRSVVDERVLEASLENTGAVVMGRNTFDVVDGPHGWNDDMGFGGVRDGSELPHNFVVTHEAPESVRLEGAFTFVVDGVESAIAQAKARAGDLDVTVMGGGSLCRQVIAGGLADEVRIHLAPAILGSGTALFDGVQGFPTTFEAVEARFAPAATHLLYRVER